MILKRLANALKRQDWFQVTIEVLIVVVGIFLGFQVTEWNDRRNEVQQEINLLASLARDIEANIATLDEALALAEVKRIASRELLLRSAGGPSNNRALDELIGELTWWHSVKINNGALESYLLSDNIALIKNAQLREELLAIPGTSQAIIEYRLQDYETYKTMTLPFLMHGLYMPQLNNSLLANPGDGTLQYDQLPLASELITANEILLKNKDFLNILVVTYWDQDDLIREYIKFKNSFQHVLDIINRELDKN